MGRTVYAEEHLRAYLATLGKPDGYAIGLILGQNIRQRNYVVHLAKTPPLAKNIVEETLSTATTVMEQHAVDTYIKSIKDIPMGWVADHAKHVTRMLPGGMWVLGIFIVGPEDILETADNVQTLKSILGTIHNTLSYDNKHLCGDNQDEKLILSFNSVTQKHVCKSVDVCRDVLKPADWKFQEKTTKWYQLDAFVDFNRLYLIDADQGPVTLKRHLQAILSDVENLINSSLVVIEGEVRPLEDTMEVLGRKKNNSKECKNKQSGDGDDSFQVNLYIPCYDDLDAKLTSCSASIRLVGQLVSRTFIHQKASIAEAILAVKQDIMRSLASRLDMHWDSLIGEENGSPEEYITLHEPPRRVLIALPGSNVTLSDYLFPGEGPQGALVSLQELLDLKMEENQVQQEVELQTDPTEFYYQSDVNTKSSDHGINTSSFCRKIVPYIGLCIALLIVVTAIIVYQLAT